MSFWDDYMLIHGWSARSASTPTSEAEHLKFEGVLVTQLANLEKGINTAFSHERIAQLKAGAKIRAERIRAETNLAKVDVTDRNGVRSAMARMHSALVRTQDDLQKSATHRNEVLISASVNAGRRGIGPGFDAFFNDKSGTAASPGSRLRTNETTATWETLIDRIGDDKVRITEDGGIEIAEGTGMGPGLIARIQDFHNHYQRLKQNQTTLLSDVRSDIAEVDAEMETVSRDVGDAEVAAALGRVRSIATRANNAIDESPLSSGEAAAEELNEFYEKTKLQQTLMARLEDIQSTAGGDPKRALLKQFVGRDAAQQWAKDRGLSIGYVDDAGNYVAGRHDMRAAMQFGWETTRGVAEGGKQARYGVGMRRPTDEWVRVTMGYSPEDQETFRHSDGGYVMRDGQPATEAELAERGLVPTFYRLGNSFTQPLGIVDPLFVDNEGRWYGVDDESGNYVQITDRRTAAFFDTEYYGTDDAGNPLYDNEPLAAKEPVVIRDSVTEKLRYMRPEEGANIAAVDESGRPLFVHEDIQADEAAQLVHRDNNLERLDTLPATREVRGRRMKMHGADLTKYGAGARRIRDELTGREEIVDINDPTVTYQVTAEEPLGVTGFPSSVKTERDVRVRTRRDEVRKRQEEAEAEVDVGVDVEDGGYVDVVDGVPQEDPLDEDAPAERPETWQRRALEKLFGVVRPESRFKGARTELEEDWEPPAEDFENLPLLPPPGTDIDIEDEAPPFGDELEASREDTLEDLQKLINAYNYSEATPIIKGAIKKALEDKVWPLDPGSDLAVAFAEIVRPVEEPEVAEPSAETEVAAVEEPAEEALPDLEPLSKTEKAELYGKPEAPPRARGWFGKVLGRKGMGEAEVSEDVSVPDYDPAQAEAFRQWVTHKHSDKKYETEEGLAGVPLPGGEENAEDPILQAAWADYGQEFKRHVAEKARLAMLASLKEPSTVSPDASEAPPPVPTPAETPSVTQRERPRARKQERTAKAWKGELLSEEARATPEEPLVPTRFAKFMDRLAGLPRPKKKKKEGETVEEETEQVVAGRQ